MDWEKSKETGFGIDVSAIRGKKPLILCMTNYVAMGTNANALLAIGASPMMSFCPEEVEELVSQSAALYINIGCLDLQQISAMRKAVSTAAAARKPWVLDPVGVGASHLRMQTCRELIALEKPSVIRGNASEIRCLSGESNRICGVDTIDDSCSAVPAARKLAETACSVVVVSGATDYIVDAEREVSVSRGHAMMEKVTAMGCTASALVAAFAAVDDDAFRASANAMLLMGLCGEAAAVRSCGTGSFLPAFLDALSHFMPERGVESI